jgi:hypothetical protein
MSRGITRGKAADVVWLSREGRDDGMLGQAEILYTLLGSRRCHVGSGRDFVHTFGVAHGGRTHGTKKEEVTIKE